MLLNIFKGGGGGYDDLLSTKNDENDYTTTFQIPTISFTK